MSWIRSPRAAAIASGAMLGALVGLCLDEVGIAGVFNFGSMLVPGMIAGAAIGATRVRPILWISGALLVMVLLIVAYTPLTARLIGPLVRADTLPAAGVDAAFVLSGGITKDGLMQSQTFDRLFRGAELLQRDSARALVVSREWVLSRSSPGVSDSAEEATVLTLLAVHTPVFFVDSATSTRDEALRMKRIAAGRGWTRVAVVTSPLHTRRACATFERVGFHVTCVPSAAREFPLHDLSGAGDRLRAFRNWVYETAGTLKYRLESWI